MVLWKRSGLVTKQLLIALLVAALTIQLPVSAYAAKKELEFIAVLELHRHDTRPDDTQKTTDRFREELSRYSHLKVLTRSESKAILEYHRYAIQEEGEVSPSQQLVSQAKQAYFALDMGRARKLTLAAIAQTSSADPLRRDHRAMLEAYTLQGIISMANNQRAEASEAFRQLVYYNPDVELDKRYFAPSVIKKISKAKEELKENPLGTISVSSKPKAGDVYVNGVFRGTAPLELTGYSEGQHVVTVKAANYHSRSRTVKVTANKTARTHLSLKWKGKNQRFPPDMVGFHRDQFASFEQLTQAAATTAEIMRVRKVILVELEKKDGNDVVTAHIVDRNLATFHRPQTVAVKDISRESARASTVLGTQVLEEMDQTLMDNPKKLAAAPYYGDIVLIGRRHKRSLLKSPWFWVGIGVAVAGGVTAAILLTRGTESKGAINVIFR